MTLGFAAFTVAAILIQSAFQNLGFFQFLAGVQSPGADPAYNILGQNVALASGGTSAPGGGGGGSVKGHPELKPGIASVVNEVMNQFPGLTITSTTGGVHATHSLHYQGRAADLAGADMGKAAIWIAANMVGQLTEGIHNPTLSVKDKHKVSPSFWGAAVWVEHRNHIHLGV